jgi:hypothetical protein
MIHYSYLSVQQMEFTVITYYFPKVICSNTHYIAALYKTAISKSAPQLQMSVPEGRVVLSAINIHIRTITQPHHSHQLHNSVTKAGTPYRQQQVYYPPTSEAMRPLTYNKTPDKTTYHNLCYSSWSEKSIKTSE